MSMKKYIDTLQWKDVYKNGICTNYQISNIGSNIINKNTGKMLKWYIDKDGYYRTGILVNGARFNVSAHRLVAHAFIPNPEGKPEVNHKDGNKSNNDVSNLEWCTNKENIEHAILTGLTKQKGENNGNNRYSESQIRKACELMENRYNRPIDVYRATGVSRAVLYEIRKGKIWNDISCEYDLPDILDDVRGENNGNHKYTENQIHHVCELLENPKNNPKYISDLTGVNQSSIHSIYMGSTWTHISSLYVFPVTNFTGENKVQAVYTNEQINKVCKMLEDPKYTYSQIEYVTGVKQDTVYCIYIKKSWSHISNGYDMKKRDHISRPMSDISARILNLLKEGKDNKYVTDIIMAEFGLQDRRKAQMKVSSVKSDYRSSL